MTARWRRALLAPGTFALGLAAELLGESEHTRTAALLLVAGVIATIEALR